MHFRATLKDFEARAHLSVYTSCHLSISLSNNTDTMPGQRSNVELLTEGAHYIKRAKRERKDQVESVKFDDDARREWLTGFSKRKKAKTEERRARAKERDHKEHLAERAKVCSSSICLRAMIRVPG